MVPVATGAGLDIPHRALLRRKAAADLEKAQATLARVLLPVGGEEAAADAIGVLRSEWRTPGVMTSKAERYRRAAQIRLVALLAPSLNADAAAGVTASLRELLPTTADDYLTREAIARALKAVAKGLPAADRAMASRRRKARAGRDGLEGGGGRLGRRHHGAPAGRPAGRDRGGRRGA